MNIALISSNAHPLSSNTTKGTEIFIRLFLESLKKQAATDLNMTVFASGDSDISFPVRSISDVSTSADKAIVKHGKTIQFELALISRALHDQDKYDLFHINIGDGDLILPFAQFVRKPILVTLHHIYDADHTRKYFSLFKENKNIFFVSASNAQRLILPDVNYIQTIYHGIDVEHFPFSKDGTETMMWAGRGIPEKGLDISIQVANKLKKQLTAFAIQKEEYIEWLDEIIETSKSGDAESPVSIYLNQPRKALVQWYQRSKVYLHPIKQEEAFGLVLAEAMSCGTPVIAFARGSIPEIVQDGVTGFIINPADDDIRGNWIIKKTGAEGFIEAANRIYDMSAVEYRVMRASCAAHARKNFSANRMMREYRQLYENLINTYRTDTLQQDSS